MAHYMHAIAQPAVTDLLQSRVKDISLKRLVRISLKLGTVLTWLILNPSLVLIPFAYSRFVYVFRSSCKPMKEISNLYTYQKIYSFPNIVLA